MAWEGNTFISSLSWLLICGSILFQANKSIENGKEKNAKLEGSLKEQQERYNQLQQKCVELEGTIKEKSSALEKLESSKQQEKEDMNKQIQAASEANVKKQAKIDEVKLFYNVFSILSQNTGSNIHKLWHQFVR